MESQRFHMPHLHLPRRGHAKAAEHHETRDARRLMKVEGAVEYLTVAGLLIVMAALAYGLMTASGQANW